MTPISLMGSRRGRTMRVADRERDIRVTLDALKDVGNTELMISRTAIGEMERLVRIIDTLTDNVEVAQEGRYLIARALGRFQRPPKGEEVSPAVWSARLHGAVARYEFILRKEGFLTAQEGEAPQDPHPRPPSGA